MEKTAQRVLYIHGFNGSPAGSTARAVQSYFGAENVTAPQLDLLDYEATMAQLETLVREKHITVIVAHSFGAFYALSLKAALKQPELFTIIANPCMEPSRDIPRLDESIPARWAAAFYKREQMLYDELPEALKVRTFGMFSDGDPLFSYAHKFEQIYGAGVGEGGAKNMLQVHGEHRIGKDELARGFDAALAYYAESLREP